MFYLKHFFQVVKNNRLNGFFFIFFTALLVTSFHQQSYFKKVFSVSKKEITKPYFNALITKKINLDAVTRKMQNLPGVSAVSIKNTMDVGRELKALSSELGSDFVQGLADLNYASLTVEMTHGLQKRSQSLIKEYLNRLVGQNAVAISDIKTPKKVKLNQKDPYLKISEWADRYLQAIIICLWIASSLSILHRLKNYSYLLEKFQRKKNVAPKIYMGGLALIVSLILGVNFYITPQINGVVFILLISMFIFSWLVVARKLEFKKLV